MRRHPIALLSVKVICACGHPDEVTFDLAAPPYSRTRQCPCGQVLEIRRPIILDHGRIDLVPAPPSRATGASPKGDPR